MAAIRAAQLGLGACVIEKSRIGGVCLNWGCIPTKALLKSAEVYDLCRRAEEFGVKVSGQSFDMAAAVKRSRQASETVTRGVEYLLRQNKITVVTGRGRLVNSHRVAVSGPDGEEMDEVEASNVIVATGAGQRSLPGVVIDGKRVITSTEAMVLDEIPDSMVIIGAGAVGVEFAYFFNAIGCKVTLLEMMPSVLPGEDGEITKLLIRFLKRHGVDIVTSARVRSVSVHGDKVKVSVEVAGAPGGAAGSGSGGSSATGGSGEPPASAGGQKGAKEAAEKTFEASHALMAVGVIPNTSDIGIEEVGVELAKGGFVKVDEYMRTTVEGVFAIGDVAGPPLLAHVASAQGEIAVETVAGEAPGPFRAELMPRCVYCRPQVASVGFTEEQARQRGHDVKVGRFPFRASGKSVAVGERDGIVKVIADAESGRLLGAAIIGAEATELIAEPTLAQNLDGTCWHLLKAVHAHPTLSEAVMEAAGDAFGMAIHKPGESLEGR